MRNYTVGTVGLKNNRSCKNIRSKVCTWRFFVHIHFYRVSFWFVYVSCSMFCVRVLLLEIDFLCFGITKY